MSADPSYMGSILQSILGGGGSTSYGSIAPLAQLASNLIGSSNNQNVSNNQGAAFNNAMGAYGLAPTTLSGPGGMSIGFGGGGPGSSPLGTSPFINLGSTLNGAFGNYSSAAASPIQGTQGMLGGLFGSNSGTQGMAGSLAGVGFGQLGNPLIGNSFGTANNLLNAAGGDYTNAYNTTLQNTLAAMQQPEQQAQAQLNDSEFQRGQLGSTGGALQTQAFAKGLGQADLQAALSAQTAGLNAFNSDISGAGTAAGIGNNSLSLGNSLLSNAFSQFNNSNAIGSNIANSIYNQNYGINNAGLNGVTALNQLGLGNLNSAVNLANISNTAGARSAATAGAIANSPNYSNGNQLLSGLLNQTANGALGSGISSLLGVGNQLNNLLGNPLGSLFGSSGTAGSGLAAGLNSLGFGGGSSALDATGGFLSNGFGASGGLSSAALGGGGTTLGSDLSSLFSGFSPAGGAAADTTAALSGGAYSALGDISQTGINGLLASTDPMGTLAMSGGLPSSAGASAGLGTIAGTLGAAAAPFVLGPLTSGLFMSDISNPTLTNPLNGQQVSAGQPGYNAISQYNIDNVVAPDIQSMQQLSPEQASAMWQQGLMGQLKPTLPQMSLTQLAQLLNG